MERDLENLRERLQGGTIVMSRQNASSTISKKRSMEKMIAGARSDLKLPMIRETDQSLRGSRDSANIRSMANKINRMSDMKQPLSPVVEHDFLFASADKRGSDFQLDRRSHVSGGITSPS